jgi:regulation of enolase protein 1 (concanavalin A-like superfamily)
MKGVLSFEDFAWARQPEQYLLSKERLMLETEPGSLFDALEGNPSGAFGVCSPPLGRFEMTVRVDYWFRRRGDECGLVFRREDGSWLKVGLENNTDHLDLACEHNTGGFGDRSCRQLGAQIRWLYLRALYWYGNLRVQYSFNGERYSDLRWLHFAAGTEKVRAGFYACSRQDSWFDCSFSGLKVKTGAVERMDETER